MVHFVGRFVACTTFPANSEVVANVLFDTEALCANHLNFKKFKFNELSLREYIHIIR